jgi:hypothetical protein
MVKASFSLREDYWENFEIQDEDIEYLYNYLLETETPLTSEELVDTLVKDRIRREKAAIEEQRTSGGEVYLPKNHYQVDQVLIFPALEWRKGKVVNVRPGHNPDLGEFEVIAVSFDGESGDTHEYAAGLEQHALNEPPEIAEEEEALDPQYVLDYHRDVLVEALEEGLESHTDFVRIAGRWFPRALLVDINVGHLNLAEAVLDMEGGGPLPTPDLLSQIELESNVNPKLLEFSLDLALQEDERFDEVGSAGKVLWFLRRLEPAEVLEPPLFLRYPGMDYERSLLSQEMLALERDLDDELSPVSSPMKPETEVDVRLIFPHWRAGTLPLSAQVRHLFPTAYEAPRIQFTLVDEETDDHYSAWVVRAKRYVYGLQEWYEKRELLPGSIITVKQGNKPGEVIINSDSRRSSREWVRTVLVGSDGGIVYAMLKQIVNSGFDERMVIAVPDPEAIDKIWEKNRNNQPPFERTVANTVRELSKLNPQNHVHATELYAALNVVRRCPPGPILSLLASRPWFVHVGDLHFRFNDSEGA